VVSARFYCREYAIHLNVLVTAPTQHGQFKEIEKLWLGE
jgi:hypothetical protein